MTQTFIKIGATLYDPSLFTVPLERTFRNAWVGNADEGVIEIDMVKAREIWRDKIRTAREPELAKLDTAFMKALETGADTSVIVSQKQALRDAPADPAIDAAATPEELKMVQPAGLTIL